MYSRRLEPLTVEHRARLRAICDVPERMTRSALGIRLAIAVVGWIVCVLPLGQSFQWIWFAAITAIAIGVIATTVTKYWSDESLAVELEASESEILADGQAEVTRIEARRAIELAGPNDEWLDYLFELDDGRVVFLNGPGEDDTDQPFPNTSFEMATTRAGERWLGIQCHGQYLDPQLARAPPDLPIDDLPETVVVDGSFADGVEDLLRRVREAAGTHG